METSWKNIVTCWAFYYVNDNTNVDLKNAQIMHCILCNKNPINATNLRTQAKSELISYFKTIGISSLKTCECISWSSCQNI